MSETVPETSRGKRRDAAQETAKAEAATAEISGPNTQCPIGRSLERIGDGWTLLILRDALQGVTRFDDFQQRLGIAPSMLTRRLNALVEDGLLERRPYSKHPPRMEYVLTECGRDVRQVIHALYAWGSKHFASEGQALRLVDTVTGQEAEPVLVDRHTGLPTTDRRFVFVPGPAANERLKRRYPTLEEIRAKRAQEAASSDPAAAAATEEPGS
ncbi:MAG TPA: helix-turn-helix domain-containing protein [Dongiaceae bacterium]|nr:helix-turn-helix domain-containing protein [Dongiaceae bacterium]